MNYSLLGADRSTQLKIAVVALVAVAAVVVGANARLSDTGTGAQARINDIVVKAGRPAQYTIRDISTIQ